MKKIFTKLMLLAVAAAALVSCENNYYESTPVVELTQTVTLSADKTTAEEAVRTQLIEGVPYWSKGDAIGVYLEDESKHYKFTNDAEEATLTTSFTGTTAVANTLFVYYPYTANGVAEKGAKVDIPVNQEPTATSFDGKADIMLAKPVTLDEEGMQVSDLEFARLGAIVKVVLNDKTGNLAGQHLSTLTMKAESNLVGRVYIDVKNQALGELYYGGSKSVTATYAEPIAANNPVYFVVYPQTLAAGSKLTFEAATEGYAISKELPIPEDRYPNGIVLEAGKLNTLTVSLAAENVIKEETGLALPFEDDFAWVTGTSESSEITTSLKAEYYATGVKAFSAGGAIKFGTGSVAGSITTVPLNLSEPFTVIVKAKKYGSDNAKIKAVVGETSQQITLTADYAYYGIEFEAATKKSSLTLEAVNASNCRFYIDELQVVAGHDVVLPTLPPVLTVSKSEISVSHEAATETFTYSVANPVDGVNVAISDNADWITTSTNGTTVTVTVAENTAEEAREGVITVTYGDLTKTVTVSQAAKPAEGGEGGETGWVRVTSLADITDGTYVIIANNGSDYYCPNSTFYSSTHPKAVKLSDKGVSVSGEKLSGTIIDDMKWTFTGTSSNMVITKYNSTDQLYDTATNNGVWVGKPSSASYWSFAVQGSNFQATYHLSDVRHLGLYQSQDWRSYKTSSLGSYSNKDAEIRLYKLVGEEGGNEGGETPETPATPVLSINPTTLSFDAAGGNKTVACTIENEVSGVNVTATENVDWLTTSVSGKTVTVTATANTGAARNATVTIAYTGAESKTVTVNQAAAENTGGDEGGSSEPVTKTINLTGGSGNNGASWSFTSSPVTCTVVTNGNSTAPRLDSNLLRMYASSGKSNLMTITTDSSPKKKITKVIVYCTSSDYATALNNGAATVDSGASVSKSKSGNNVVYTITGNTESIKITTGGQARMNKIDVTYQD